MSLHFTNITIKRNIIIFDAQEAGDETQIVESGGRFKDLGRRSKIIVEKIKTGAVRGDDPVSIDFGLDVDSNLGTLDALFASLSMILVSEIDDETFIIAALMLMRHPKSIVLSSALFVMTILSTGLGRIVPNLISRKHTNSAKKEIEEVEEKLEAGQGKAALRRSFSRFLTPIFLEAFILNFLATIALATHKNAIGVAVGATIGHTICTPVAVIGGSMLASKISQRTVATTGGLLFLVIVFLSTSMILTSYNLILHKSRCSNLFSVIP
uniref:GDT1 family protein n=1 Tax=Solanum lycopersicum TaxID=4081 RepID=K4CS15_SOLLC